MILSTESIKSITFGAIKVYENEGKTLFSRFEGDPVEYYKTSGRSTASVMLDFYTDSETLSLDYSVHKRIDRNHAYFDLYEDEVMVSHFGKTLEKDESEYTGHFETSLGKGEKRIRLYFPNLFETRIISMSLDDGSTVRRSEKKKKLLMMGDSITHGYDAYFPSLSYANTVAREFDFDMINQAIGGEMFRTKSLPEKTSLAPDYITVAYGTNDWSWSGKTLEECTNNAKEYFEKLVGLYKKSKIFYISPLYRGDEKRITTLGDFFEAVESFSEVARGFGCSVINGRELIPHDSLMFDDKYLHPNDLGFTQYAKALEKELRKLGVN